MADIHGPLLYLDAIMAVIDSFQDPELEVEGLTEVLELTDTDNFEVNSFVVTPEGYYAAITARTKNELLWQVAHKKNKGTIVQLWTLTNTTNLEF